MPAKRVPDESILLKRITQLHADVDDTFLLTFRELDHCPNRPGNPRCRGIWEHSEGGQPTWPLCRRYRTVWGRA